MTTLVGSRRLGAFIARGHRAVFIVGNHDVELYWPSVQRMICDALSAALPSNIGEEEDDDPIVFCNWFYLSGGDTYVSHGHQYDPNCVVRDPIDPLIEVHGQPRVRIPFGDLAARYMLNGMGYFNPHQSENYIMSAVAYVRFFFRYMLRTQPLLIWTWLWGAYATLWISLRTHWLPAMRDPMLVDDKVRSIATQSPGHAFDGSKAQRASRPVRDEQSVSNRARAVARPRVLPAWSRSSSPGRSCCSSTSPGRSARFGCSCRPDLHASVSRPTRPRFGRRCSKHRFSPSSSRI